MSNTTVSEGLSEAQRAEVQAAGQTLNNAGFGQGQPAAQTDLFGTSHTNNAVADMPQGARDAAVAEGKALQGQGVTGPHDDGAKGASDNVNEKAAHDAMIAHGADCTMFGQIVHAIQASHAAPHDPGPSHTPAVAPHHDDPGVH